LEYFDRALKIEPKSAFALRCKGEALRMLGRFEDSIKCFDDSLVIEPKVIFAMRYKAEALRGLSKYNESFKACEDVLALDANNAFALRTKGEVLRMLSKYPESLIAFDRALEIESKNVFALKCRGETLRLMARYQESLESCNAALKITPTDAEALSFRRKTLNALGINETTYVEDLKRNSAVEEPKVVITEAGAGDSPAPTKSSPKTWKVDEVCQWAKGLSLSQSYDSVLKSGQVDGVVLLTMKSKEDWNELGIAVFGDVRKLVNGVISLT